MGTAATAIQNLELHALIALFSVICVFGLLHWNERCWRLPRDRWFSAADPPKALDPAYQEKVEQVTADAIKHRAEFREQEQSDLDTAKAEWMKRATDYSA